MWPLPGNVSKMEERPGRSAEEEEVQKRQVDHIFHSGFKTKCAKCF